MILIRMLISVLLFSATTSYSFDRTVSSSWLKNKMHIDESDSRIRSGAIIGIREFTDPSTLTFELATQSRFGHVGIFISTEDMMEAYLQALTQPEIYNDFIQRLLEIIPDQTRYHSDFYTYSAEQRILKMKASGLIRSYLNNSKLLEKIEISCFLKDNLKNKNFDEVKNLAIDIYKKEQLITPKNEIIKDCFGDYLILPFDYKGGVILDMSPSIHLSEWATPHFISAISKKNISVIQPQKDLTIEQISKILIYRFVMQKMNVRYNFNQSIQGYGTQNCSEFVHNAFSLIGINNIGVEQNMNSLNTKTLGGSLKTVSVLSGQYSSSKKVITPKSVMMSGYNHPDMEVVHDLDFLNIKNPISDRTLYNEWKEAGKLHWNYKALKVFGCGWNQPSDSIQNNNQEENIGFGVSNSTIASSAVGAAIVGIGVAYFTKLFH